MILAGFEAKHVAGKVKGTDLAATIGESLMGPNCSFNYLIDIVSWLLLSENLSAFTVLEFP